ncbi:MAG: sodium/proline symporter [Pseudomonadota bacterium]
MTRDATVLATLAAYNLLLLAMGIWASSRNRDNRDFLLAGGRMGGWIAGLSASASSSSAWTLLGVSGSAYLWGHQALWLLPATLGGFLINWVWVAPRLQRVARSEGALTLTAVVAPATLGRARVPIMRVASVIIVFCFSFYIAAQFDGAGKAFAENFGWSQSVSILVGAAVVAAYTMVGGFWAVSVTDALQALLMVFVAIVLPALVLFAGVDGGTPAPPRLTHASTPIAIGFALGTLGIGLGYPGQPHVVSRFMALRDHQALIKGRRVAVIWAVLVYSGMLTLGIAARRLGLGVADGEAVLFAAANAVLPPVAAGLVLAAVLAAIMSTADSQLLTAAGSIAYDWRGNAADAAHAPTLTRAVVLLVCVAAVGLAIGLPQDIFSRVLFAWHAIGSAFGPLLVARLLGYQPGAGRTLASMLIGFALTVVFHAQPNAPGDWIERLVPLALAGLVLIGTRRAPAA